MATYKFVNADQLDADLLTVADKIREKAELSDPLAFPSGFVDGIDQCSSLNFSVVGGTTQPSDPKENTIWVNTDTEISGWIFSATEPEAPEEGMVWITTGTKSAIEFNALKKNGIQVYPLSAKQYVDGALVDVDAMSYIGGEWLDWANYLYNLGNNIAEFYAYKPTNGSYAAIIPTTFTEDGILVSTSGGSTQGVRIITKEKIDFTWYSKLYCMIDFQTAVSSGTYSFLRVVSATSSSSYVGSTSHSTPWEIGEYLYELDVSGFEKNYVEINIDSYDTAVSLLVKKVWLE